MSNLNFYLNNGQNTIPTPGSIIAYLGRNPPNGWILCDGQQLQYDSFPNLGSILEGTGGTFNVPNLSGLFLRGQGSQINQEINKTYNNTSNIRDIQLDTFISHSHEISYDVDDPGGSASSLYAIGTTNYSSTSFGISETRPYSYGVFWIIKTDILPTVPGQPTITSHTGTPSTQNGTSSLQINFTAPTVNSNTITNYEYSTDFGISWTARSPTSYDSPISIPNTTNSYSSVRLRAVNSSGAGQASPIYYGLGFYFRMYTGYLNFTTPLVINGTRGGATLSILNTADGTNGLINPNDMNYFTVQWIGNFYADISGNWTFSTTSDDASYVWVGDSAYSNIFANALVQNTGGGNTVTEIIYLIAGQYYPIRIAYGENYNQDSMKFEFIRHGESTLRTNGSGYFFSPFSEQIFTNF